MNEFLNITEEWIGRLIWTIEIDVTRAKKIQRVKQMIREIGIPTQEIKSGQVNK